LKQFNDIAYVLFHRHDTYTTLQWQTRSQAYDSRSYCLTADCPANSDCC